MIISLFQGLACFVASWGKDTTNISHSLSSSVLFALYLPLSFSLYHCLCPTLSLYPPLSFFSLASPSNLSLSPHNIVHIRVHAALTQTECEARQPVIVWGTRERCYHSLLANARGCEPKCTVLRLQRCKSLPQPPPPEQRRVPRIWLVCVCLQNTQISFSTITILQ